MLFELPIARYFNTSIFPYFIFHIAQWRSPYNIQMVCQKTLLWVIYDKLKAQLPVSMADLA